MDNINFTFSFTERAHKATNDLNPDWGNISFPGAAGMPVPNSGDVFTMPPFDPLVFVVIERRFRFETDQSLLVTLLLDLVQKQ